MSPSKRFAHAKPKLPLPQTHLRLDQDQVDEQDDVVMLDVFVAEAPAVLADREPDVVAARLVPAGVGVLCP